MHKFHRKETGKWEDIAPEKWQWEAHYKDKSILKQFSGDGIFHQFGEIEQSRLVAFKMVSNDKQFTLLFNPQHMKLIHFYRNIVLDNGKRRIRLYCFGYETKVKGITHKVILVITPENELIVTEDISRVTMI